MPTPEIELRNVWKIYTMGNVKVPALKNVSVKVKAGEFLAVLGPSGSGKSTAMNMIGALDYPTKGAILLEGRNISQLSESDLAQVRGRKIGFVFQQFNLIPTLNAVENVSLPMLFQGASSYERTKRGKELLDLVNLSHRYDHLPTQMSGGEQQRVAIARALANDPDVILADEPTGNLDSKNGSAIMDFFERLNKKEKKTFIMITHDERLSKRAGRVVRLKDGEVVK